MNCDPDWHQGRQVDADYLVKEFTSDKPMVRIAVCRMHLETAVHVAMVRCGTNVVSVEEVERG